MTVQLVELTADEVTGLNQKIIADDRRRRPGSTGTHAFRNPSGLRGCVGGVFMQLQSGYVHLPLEKTAGLLLYRVAQGQFFLDGNKRTALLSCVAFLWNNGHRLRTQREEVADLMWGFASPVDDPDKTPKYKEEDAVRFVFQNILPSV